ncbi:MAG TPA: hypothetical protein VHY37_09095 [Tepidisphaeraceae bacterium]|nr:hypothetical protein [Tepidisphaeraceae bacterium]
MGNAIAEKPSAAVRTAEAVVLIACGLVFIASDLVIGGQVSVAMQVISLLPGIAALGLCAYLALRGDAGLGVAAAGLGLIISYFWIDHLGQQAYQANQHQLQFPPVQDSVPAAHLWANGVDLGHLPVLMTRDEFLKRVPEWTHPPADLHQMIRLPVYGSNWHECWRSDCGKWEADPIAGQDHGDYYFQATYAGETGVMQPNTGSTIGGFVFPQRDRRLQLLLSKARLADYHVSADWFRTIDTFDEDGWIALRQAERTEPGMAEVLDDWAKWKYGLDSVHSPADAWAALQRICRDANQQHHYLSSSVAAREVQSLASQVDPRQLVGAGESIIAGVTSYSYLEWQSDGRSQFGVYLQPGEPIWLGDSPSSGALSIGVGNGYGRAILPSDLVILQALQDMWYSGRARELFQSRIAPDLLAWHYKDGWGLPGRLAAMIGGPDVDRFLLAQSWQQPGGYGEHDTAEVSDANVNRWLYFLACLNDSAGRQFHRDYSREILDFVDTILPHELFFGGWEKGLNFLFADPALARQYWPRFVAISRSRPQDADQALREQFIYLNRMHAAPAQYVEMWKQATDDAREQGIGALMYNIPADQARPAAEALLTLIQNSKPRGAESTDDRGRRPGWIDELHQIVSPEDDLLSRLRPGLTTGPAIDPHALATAASAHIPSGGGQNIMIVLWLSRPGACSPVVATLATAPEPAFRLLSLNAIRNVPTPANRQLLRQLLIDPNASVRVESQGVEAELKALAAEPVGELTSTGK